MTSDVRRPAVSHSLWRDHRLAEEADTRAICCHPRERDGTGKTPVAKKKSNRHLSSKPDRILLISQTVDTNSETFYDAGLLSLLLLWVHLPFPLFVLSITCGVLQPFSGIYLHHSEVGMYHCVCCDAPLFRYQWKKSIILPAAQLSPEWTTLVCLLLVQSQSTTPGRAGRHLKRLMGRGRRMKATPPLFVALTTALAVRGQRSSVKM